MLKQSFTLFGLKYGSLWFKLKDLFSKCQNSGWNDRKNFARTRSLSAFTNGCSYLPRWIIWWSAWQIIADSKELFFTPSPSQTASDWGSMPKACSTNRWFVDTCRVSIQYNNIFKRTATSKIYSPWRFRDKLLSTFQPGKYFSRTVE